MVAASPHCVLIDTLDTDLPEIAVRISVVGAQVRDVDIHSVGKIKILRLPKVHNGCNANPGGFEIGI